MKNKRLFAASLCMACACASMAQDAAVDAERRENMKKDATTVRLIYPQWQGGLVDRHMPDLPKEDSSRGYFLGAKILEMLAPETSDRTLEVPVSQEYGERKIDKGIIDRDAVVRQTKAALELLREADPDRIATLGGECSVSVAPFAHLMKKYEGETAIVWLDAHPDISLPYDDYPGYHAMALTACMGMGDAEIMSMLPAKCDASKAIVVGLRAYEKTGGTKERQERIGLASLSPEEVRENSDALIAWLRKTGAKKVLLHFDMDVLDPAEIIAAVGTDPNGLSIEQAIRIINDVNQECEIVGLTVAEPMPRVAIKLRNMMKRLPLLGNQ